VEIALFSILDKKIPDKIDKISSAAKSGYNGNGKPFYLNLAYINRGKNITEEIICWKK
jgi:hypothetical protein